MNMGLHGLRAVLMAATVFAGVSVRAELRIELNPERIERGEYLTLRVMGCQGCHSERTLDRYGYPPREDRVLAGGIIFRALGDRAISPNLTPYALGDWSDQEIFDAITRGVRPDGRVLAPEMPYERYGTMDPERIYDVIAYLRSLDPVNAGPYPAEFPGEHQPFEPRFGELVDPGSGASDEERGAYLVDAAGCNGCHGGTGEGVDGALLAGGREFGQPGRGMIRAANLTPDSATGLGAWTLEAWLARFRAMRGAEQRAVSFGQPNTVMHWWQYSYMTDQDLEAIYAYLRTVPAVSNQVVRFEPLPGVVMSPNWSDQVASDD